MKSKTARKKPGRPGRSCDPWPLGQQALSYSAVDEVKEHEMNSLYSNLRQRLDALTEDLGVLRRRSLAYEHLLNRLPVGLVSHDPRGIIRETNAAAALLLGLRPEQAVGAGLATFFTREDVPAFWEHLRQCAQRRACKSRLRLHSCKGRVWPVEVVSVKAGSGSLLHTILVDISPSVAAQAALNEKNEDFEQLVNTLDGIVCEIVVPEMVITFVSRYAQRLLGYPVEAWHRPGFWEGHIFPDDRERVRASVAEVISTRRPQAVEYRALTVDRKIVWIRDNISLSERSDVKKLICVGVDVTDRKAVEEHLRQQHEQLEQRVEERTTELRATVAELEAFSYSLSHDMRSPIRAIRGYAEILEHLLGQEPAPPALDYLQRIQTSAGRLDMLVRDVLTYSRVIRMPWEPQALNVGSMVEAVIREYPDLQKTRIDVRRPLASVLGHDIFLFQILSNLLSNAAKFTQPGQQAQVSIWTEEAPSNKHAARRPRPTAGAGAQDRATDNGFVRICVEDHGIGIAPQYQGQIFGMFQRLHGEKDFPGTGIGLAIVQKAARRMGGRVGLESRPGEGSRFWVDLPKAPAFTDPPVGQPEAVEQAPLRTP